MSDIYNNREFYYEIFIVDFFFFFLLFEGRLKVLFMRHEYILKTQSNFRIFHSICNIKWEISCTTLAMYVMGFSRNKI